MGLGEAVTGPVPAEGARLAAGVGFRRGAPAEEIVALVRAALAQVAAGADRLALLATAEDRAGEAPLRAAAAAFGLAPTPVPPAALAAIDARVPTRSPRIEAARGVGSLAEAAALAASGGPLALARIASPNATCALAYLAPSGAGAYLAPSGPHPATIASP
ncbi:cobalamin biosynthesis protein [Methylobacterium sp. A54F]